MFTQFITIDMQSLFDFLKDFSDCYDVMHEDQITSSIRFAPVFQVNEIALNKRAFSGHTILTVFIKHYFMKSPSL